MRSEILIQLNTDLDYFQYIKETPIWYKILSIYPYRLKDFIDEYKVARKKRIIDKIDDINALINLTETFLKK